MFLANVSIKRPVFATILNLVLIVFGIFTYMRLRVDLIPNIEIPVVFVQVVYPGADPKTVEERIVEPIEKALAGIEGVENISGTAVSNLGRVVLELKVGTNLERVANDVRDKVGAIQFPQEARAPLIAKFNIGADAVVVLSVSSSDNQIDLAKLVKDRIKPRFEQIEGVGSVDISGLREKQIQVEVSREKLQTYGLSVSQIAQAIQSQALDYPSGKIENDRNVYVLRTESMAKSLEDIKKIPIVAKQGQKLRIEDVATVQETLADEENFALYNGNPSLILSIKKQSDGNTVLIADEAKKRIEDLRKELPQSVSLSVVQDNSTFIKESLNSVKFDLALGALLAIVIVFFFLHDWRATVISALAIPTAVVGTFTFIYAFGFTFNVVTALALTLSIGILVDDAIVVIENIYRRLQLGESPLEAARKGTAEIGLAAIAITLSIVGVFGPVAFMEGIIGQFFYSFGLTVVVAVLLSLFVAFTLTPMLSSKLLQEHEESPFWLRPVAKFLKACDTFYRSLLDFCLKTNARIITVVIAAFVVFIFSIVLMLRFVPMAFSVTEDRSQFSVTLTLREGTSLQASKERALEIESWLRSMKAVTDVVALGGTNADRKPNVVNFLVRMTPKATRDFSQSDFVKFLRTEMQKRFIQHPDEHIELFESGMGGPGGKALQVNILGNNLQEVSQVANKLKEKMMKYEGIVDASTSEPPAAEEYKVVIDPLRSADLNVNTFLVGQSLRTLFEGLKVAQLDTKEGTMDVVVKMDKAYTQSTEALGGISVINPLGFAVPLSNIANIEKGPAPSKIERMAGTRTIQFAANYTGKNQNAMMQTMVKELESLLVPGVTYRLSGSSRVLADSLKSFQTTLMLSVILIFMILAAQFENFFIPIILLLTVVLSLIGFALGLIVTGSSFTMFAMIGAILLVGIVTKNAILLVDFALQRIRGGMNPKEALLDAGPIRLRPILMTTAAMIGGMLPIAIGHGEGGEARAPMAIGVIGGLISSTILTLVVVPCAFMLLQYVPIIFCAVVALGVLLGAFVAFKASAFVGIVLLLVAALFGWLLLKSLRFYQGLRGRYQQLNTLYAEVLAAYNEQKACLLEYGNIFKTVLPEDATLGDDGKISEQTLSILQQKVAEKNSSELKMAFEKLCVARNDVLEKENAYKRLCEEFNKSKEGILPSLFSANIFFRAKPLRV